jgi:CheY-like chemotaxis protein
MKAGGTKMADKIRVLLADDHAVVRQGIRRFLEEAGDIEVVARPPTGKRRWSEFGSTARTWPWWTSGCRR